jgi:hypothetical protein
MRAHKKQLLTYNNTFSCGFCIECIKILRNDSCMHADARTHATYIRMYIMKSFVSQVLHIMHENFRGIVSVAFDNNGIQSMSQFRNLPSLCPTIQNCEYAYKYSKLYVSMSVSRVAFDNSISTMSSRRNLPSQYSQ